MGTGALAAAALLETLLGGSAGGSLLVGTAGGVGANFVHQLGDLFATKLASPGGVSRDFLRNEDLERLVGKTVGAQLQQLADDSSIERAVRTRLPVLALKAQAGWLVLAPHEDFRDANASGLTRLFAMRATVFADARLLDAETWADFLEFLEREVADEGLAAKTARLVQTSLGSLAAAPLDRAGCVAVGSRLAEAMPGAIHTAAKKAFQENDPAFAALQLRLMRELMTDIRDVLATSAATAENVEKVLLGQGELRSMMERVADAAHGRVGSVLAVVPEGSRREADQFASEIRARHGEIVERLGRIEGKVDEIGLGVGRVESQLEVVIRQLSERGGIAEGRQSVHTPTEQRTRGRSRRRLGDRNRDRMLARVHDYWIEGVLNQAVNESNRFNIGYELTPSAVLRQVDFPDCDLPAGNEIRRLFKYLGSQILILGSPGSGKTIVLLQLAAHLLEAAREDEKRPLPIVLSLSSWARNREPIPEWIATAAATTYQVPRRVIQRWVSEEMVVPLLDGLDELPEGDREACVESINRFRTSHRGVGLAVCSRLADYETLKARLDLRSAIVLRPLDDAQVAGVLSRPELAAARARMVQETWLEPMARVPFLLNVMSYAYAGCEPAELALSREHSDEGGRRAHMLDAYVTRRLADTRERREGSAQEVRRLLGWLASNMVERGQILFHIESIQMDWIDRLSLRLTYCVASRVLFAVVATGAVWLVCTALMGSAFFVPGVMEQFGAEQLEEFWQLPAAAVGTGAFFFFTSGVYAAALEFARSSQGAAARRFVRQTAVYATVVGSLCLLAGTISVFGLGLSANPGRVALTTWPIWYLLWNMACAAVLAHLARRMRVRSSVVFHSTVALLALLPLGFFADMRTLPSEQPAWMNHVLAIFLALLHACIMGLLALFGDEVRTAERLRWRWNVRAGLAWLAPWLALAILIGSMTTSSGGRDLRSAAFIVIFGLGCGIAGGTALGFRRAELIERRLRPNEGVLKSARTGILLAGAFGAGGAWLLASLILAVSYGNRATLSESIVLIMALAIPGGAIFASIGLMIGGFDVPVKHALLRVLVAIDQRVPIGLRSRLDSCAKQLLLRKVGGGYLFVHRYILEYFAACHRSTRG